MIRRISFIAALARLIAYEHDTLGRRWKDYELARRGVGILTVMVWALPLVRRERGIGAWFTILAGFMVAGATKMTLSMLEDKDYRLLQAELKQ